MLLLMLWETTVMSAPHSRHDFYWHCKSLKRSTLSFHNLTRAKCAVWKNVFMQKRTNRAYKDLVGTERSRFYWIENGEFNVLTRGSVFKPRFHFYFFRGGDHRHGHKSSLLLIHSCMCAYPNLATAWLGFSCNTTILERGPNMELECCHHENSASSVGYTAYVAKTHKQPADSISVLNYISARFPWFAPLGCWSCLYSCSSAPHISKFQRHV